jgi:hypothetical protein
MDIKYLIAPTGELYHYGVKGMKWGVRQANEASRELNRKRRVYKRSVRDYNRAVYRQRHGRDRGDTSRKAIEAQLAKQEYKRAKSEFRNNAPTRVKVERGAKKAATALAKVGALYAVDKKYFGGAGAIATKMAAETAIKTIGMTAVTAYTIARGGTNIKWYA